MQERLVLIEMRLLPSPAYPVMERLIHPATGRAAQAFGCADQLKVYLTRLGRQADSRRLPRRLETQG